MMNNCTCSMTKVEIRRNISRTSMSERSTFSSSECLTSNSRNLFRSDSVSSSSYKIVQFMEQNEILRYYSQIINTIVSDQTYISHEYRFLVIGNKRFRLFLSNVCIHLNRVNYIKLRILLPVQFVI